MEREKVGEVLEVIEFDQELYEKNIEDHDYSEKITNGKDGD